MLNYQLNVTFRDYYLYIFNYNVYKINNKIGLPHFYV